jgi:hypothetical protein
MIDTPSDPPSDTPSDLPEAAPPTPPVPPSQPPPGVEPPPPPPAGAIPPPPTPPGGPYPTTFNVDYPDRELDKATTFFRIFTVIPIAIVLSAIGGYYAFGHVGAGTWKGGLGGGGVLVMPVALLIIFREKYPRWWFDFNLELVRFISRVGIYALLMTDEYPSTDMQQSVHLEIKYPDAHNDLNRFMPLIKWLLAVPHFIVLFFLGIGAFFATIYAWFVILFTGRYPQDVFELVEGVMRWHLRVFSYALLLTTDEYPPFRLSA